jgi:hypothetical protein
MRFTSTVGLAIFIWLICVTGLLSAELFHASAVFVLDGDTLEVLHDQQS